MRWLWTIGTYAYLLAGTALAGSLAFVFSLLGDRRGRLWWPVARAWGKSLLAVGGARPIEYVGARPESFERATIVMSNHESHFDPPLLIASFRPPLRFLAKHTLRYFPIFGQAMWAMGFIFINRGVQEKAFRSIERAARDLVRHQRSLLVFPEGTRTRTGEMLSFKKGGFVLAIKSGAPILPVGIAGTRPILPPGWTCRGRGPVVLVVGEPIETSRYTLESKEALMERVRREIEALRAQARSRRNELLAGAKGAAALPS